MSLCTCQSLLLAGACIYAPYLKPKGTPQRPDHFWYDLSGMTVELFAVKAPMGKAGTTWGIRLLNRWVPLVFVTIVFHAVT